MKRNIYKTRQKILKLDKIELSSISFSFIKNNTLIPLPYRQSAMISLAGRHKKFNFSRTPRFCIVSGRARFILKNLNFSRMFLKKFMSTGFLCGFYKSSW